MGAEPGWPKRRASSGARSFNNLHKRIRSGGDVVLDVVGAATRASGACIYDENIPGQGQCKCIATILQRGLLILLLVWPSMKSQLDALTHRRSL